MISKLAKKAGVKLSMKSLRRGFGCRYARRVPAQVLQKLMRHASIRTTTDYSANVEDAAEEAVKGARRVSSRVTPQDGTPEAGTHVDASAAPRTDFD
jgi:integrase